jgi:hypothetical protein
MTSFGFDMLFEVSVLLFALRETFKLKPVKKKAALLVHIRPYFIFFFRSQATFYFRRVVRNDSFVRRLRRQ